MCTVSNAMNEHRKPHAQALPQRVSLLSHHSEYEAKDDLMNQGT